MYHLIRILILILHILAEVPPQTPTENIDYTSKPNGDNWPGRFNSDRTVFADWLINGNWNKNNVPQETYRKYEYEGYDGWYNNLAHPDFGAIDRPLLRRWPAAYKDGVYEPSGWDRPNPLILSDKLLSGPIGTKSDFGKNALLVYFGQQVVEEILDSQRPACPPEYFNIPIPDNHHYKINKPHHSVLPFLRTRYDQTTGFSPNNPRQQINEITPYLDGGLFYGTTKQWSDRLRTYKNGTIDPTGKLASSHDGKFPEYNYDRLPMANPPPPFYHGHYTKGHETERVSRFFKLGNPRGNENAFLLTFGIMWFRWHNYLASNIHRHHPNWTSEKIFNEARKWTIATQQQIVINEWLPSWVGQKLQPYKYDPSIDPQIDQFFQAAAFRFGHTLVTPGVHLRDYVRNGCRKNFTNVNWQNGTIRTCNIFWRGQEPILNKTWNGDYINIERILMGMAVQLCEKEDHKIVEDLRGNVFGPLEFPRRDLMALNIQRGRDHGLPDFNSARQAFGLPRVGFKHFLQITGNMTLYNELIRLYNNDYDKIDPWVGGILETKDGVPGELFRTVILDQFRRIRDGDRFWFENINNKLFTKEEIKRIKQIRLYDILMAVTNMDPEDIPKNPFRAPQQPEDNELINVCQREIGLEATPGNGTIFYHLPQINSTNIESCSQENSYDYFSGSELSFILTFLSIFFFLLSVLGLVFFLIKLKEKENLRESMKRNEVTRNTVISDRNITSPIFVVNEWQKKGSLNQICIVLNARDKYIDILNIQGNSIRIIDCKQKSSFLVVYYIDEEIIIVLRGAHSYDLVLKFDSKYMKDKFKIDLENFIATSRVTSQSEHCSWKVMLPLIYTKEDRQHDLEEFYKVAFAQTFSISLSKSKLLKFDDETFKKLENTQLTLQEFSDAMKMPSNNELFRIIFKAVDKDGNGYVSFREFGNLIALFASGKEEDKLKFLFDMYDINGVKELTQEDFKNMIKFFLDMIDGRVNDQDIEITIQAMMRNANIQHKQKLDFEDFKKMIGPDIKKLEAARIGFTGVKKEHRQSHLLHTKNSIEELYESKADLELRLKGPTCSNSVACEAIIHEKPEDALQKPSLKALKYLKKLNSRGMDAFWKVLYTQVLFAIFAERAYYYSVEREHSGLRRIAGYGVTITRGAASAMMFTYSSLLFTMCRNLFTFARETFLRKYFPFDYMVEIHKFIAYWAFFFTVLHIIGHGFNFYHISTQTSDDLTCLFRNYFHSTHEIPKFHYWCWNTLTGITGIILTLIWIVMYVFAQTIVRRKLYNYFWYMHNLYPLFYIFMILHGCGRLIQPPFTYYFLMFPLVTFVIDSLISISRKKVEIPIIRAKVLPSGVTMLEFKKPDDFDYKSGQWVKIACLAMNKNEYHPFTISSSPLEENVTLHIRSVGPWTTNLRQIYENHDQKNLPKIYLDGPYGGRHQDWNTYEVSILIGGGIGVTPFASILKDIVLTPRKIFCKKVYFIWISKTQNQFEWMIDIIREVEEKDKKKLISSHIYITQFYEKYDLRMIFLYIFERHFQRISNKSLFTGLETVTHFGRPNIAAFCKSVERVHNNVKRIGVFSCGNAQMQDEIDKACNNINADQGINSLFEHINYN